MQHTRFRPTLTWLAVIAAAAVALYAWWWIDRKRAFDAHLLQGHARTPRLLERIATLPRELAESSGVAVSRVHAGVLWSHNDSGDGPFLYAVDLAGRLLQKVRVTGASAQDWEDLSSGPCPQAPDDTRQSAPASCLYIGDIGDNRRLRRELTVYVVTEPALQDSAGLPITVAASPFRFRYPSTRDDSEALAVGPTGDLLIVTKGRTGAVAFFQLPAARVREALHTGDVLTADHLMDVPVQDDHGVVPLVTAAAVSPDGRTLAVRTYQEVFFYRRPRNGSAATMWQRVGPACFLGAAEPQGEAIDYLDTDTLLLTSESSRGRGGSMHRLRC